MESSRVLDERFGALSPDAEVGVVIKVVAAVLGDLHLSVVVKHHEKTLESGESIYYNSRGSKQGAHITTEEFTLVALNKKVPRLFCATESI